MNRKEELLKELEEIEKNEKFSERNEVIRKLEDVPTEEKIIFFDEFFNDALSQLNSQEKEYRYEIETQYSWEAQMSLLQKVGGKDFWDFWNNLEK